MLTVAACCVGLIVKPGRRGQAETSFAAALTLDSDNAEPEPPRVELRCLDNGSLLLRRCGLTGLTDTAVVALAITRIGFDIEIEERVTPGRGGADIDRATFIIGDLGAERYHIKYNASQSSLFMATSFTLKPGVHKTCILSKM